MTTEVITINSDGDHERIQNFTATIKQLLRYFSLDQVTHVAISRV